MDEKLLAINPQDIQDVDSHYVRGEPFKCMNWLEMHAYPLKHVALELNMRLDYLHFIMKRWPNRYDKFSHVHETIKHIGTNIHEACVNIENEKLYSALSILESILSSVLNCLALQREVEYAHELLNFSNYWFEVEDTENNPPSYLGMSIFPQGVEATKLVAEFVDTLLQKLKYVVSCRLNNVTSQSEVVKTFEMKLKFLRGFFWFTSTTRCIKFHGLEDLFARVRVLLDQAACIYYWCYVEKLSPDVEYDMIRTITCWKIFPYEVELRDNYLRALKAFQSPPLLDTHIPHSSKLVVAIADSLVDSFMELADKKSESKVPTTLRIETITQDLSLLITLLSDLRRENIIKLDDLLTYVKDQYDKLSLNSALGKMDKDQSSQVKSLYHRVRGMIKLMKVEFSLIDLQKTISNNSMVYWKGEIQILYEELKSFTTLVFNLPGQWDRHIEVLSDILETVISSYNIQYLNEDMDKKFGHGPFELSVKVKLIKTEVSLRKLMKNQLDLVKDKIENLVGDLELLGNFLLDPPEQYAEHERKNDLISSVNEMAGETDSIVESLCGMRSDEEEVAGKLNVQLSDVLQHIKLIKTMDREICPKFPKFCKTNFPTTDGLGFLDFLIGDLVENLEFNSDATFLLKHHIEIVQRELQILREFLEKFEEQHNEHEELRSLWVQIVGVAYEVEYIVDSYVVNGRGTIWYHMLSDVLEEIHHIKEKVTKFSEYGYEYGTHSVGTVSYNSMPQKTENPKANEVVVGFEDVLRKLKGKVIGGTSNLDVISIVGMPELGKTTVAKKLYQDCKATNHFDVCSWCCVSQFYERKELLIEILQQIIELPEKIEEKSVQDLASLLHKSVIGKRYLIFMDDVWTPDAWDDLRSPFKDDNKSSRFILTTRNVVVASYAKCYSEPEHLRWFNEEEGWMLLRQKLFQDQECPQKFVDVGKQIVDKCHGLPLSVVLVSGILRKMDITEDRWLQVEESLSSYGVGDSNSRDIIELSYKHLPEYLKPCFLYLGRFMEDEEILVSKLIWLWIAEGLVRKHKTKSLEDVGEEYLVDLVSRSLLMDAKKRHTGRVKACRVHDLLHEFCRIKAKEEKFLQYVYSDQGKGSSDFSFQDLEQRRISLCSNDIFSSLKPPIGFPVRSLNAASKTELMGPSFSFFECFRLLKVLDLERVDLWISFPKQIQLLIHLRYLAVRTGTTSIPRWIDKLAYLETLLVKGLRGEVKLPDTVWNMVRLRHVHINDRASFGFRKEVIENSSKLYDLETLSTPSLAYGDDMEKMMRKFSNLKKLRCRFLESSHYSMKLRKTFIRFPTLDFLIHLESLKVFSNGKKLSQPCEFKLPENLKKLTLSNFRLPWKEISTIATLPNLEVLKLLLRAFEGETWEVIDDEFPALKLLKLDDVILSQWDVSDDAFPNLEKLVLRKCKKLKEIPSSLGYNTTLESIEVSWCSISVTESAKQIQETQVEELARNEFKIFI